MFVMKMNQLSINTKKYFLFMSFILNQNKKKNFFRDFRMLLFN